MMDCKFDYLIEVCLEEPKTLASMLRSLIFRASRIAFQTDRYDKEQSAPTNKAYKDGAKILSSFHTTRQYEQ